MTVRKSTVEHVFGTLKHWMGWTHFLTRGIQNVGTEMSLAVLAITLSMGGFYLRYFLKHVKDDTAAQARR